MVFSGLVMDCRLATWPTSRSPDFVKATTDGVTRPPSAFGMMVGSPASMYAAAEFVVPRSIPMTLGMAVPLSVRARLACVLVRALRRTLRDRHEGGPQDPVVELVGLADLVHDRALGLGRVDVRDGLVDVWIEWLPDRADLLEALGGEDLAELALDEPDALDPRRPAELRGYGIERP